MKALDPYRGERFNLEELVEAANSLLPRLLPADIPDQRLKEEVTPRLIRHYVTRGSVDEPEKEGREARYTYRHLLQILALRRLQAEGYRTGSVSPLTTGMTGPELEELLEGGRQVAVTQAPNPALQFLEGLRSGERREASPGRVPVHAVSPTSPSSPSTPDSRWIRHDLAPGLELHVRADFRFPTRSDQQSDLFLKIQSALRQYQGSRRSR